jgi:hypothetical protein
MAKIVTKKKLPAKVDTSMMIFTNRESFWDTRILAMIAMEKPPSSELMVITWFASLFQYSNGIPVVKSVILIQINVLPLCEGRAF